MDLTETEDIKKSGKNTQKNYIDKIFMTQIIMMVWSLPRDRYPGMRSQVGLKKRHYEQS